MSLCNNIYIYSDKQTHPLMFKGDSAVIFSEAYFIHIVNRDNVLNCAEKIRVNRN